MKIKINNGEIRKYLEIETLAFPRYVSPLINLANQYAQGIQRKERGDRGEDSKNL